MPKTKHRIELSDRKVKALKPAPKGKRYQVMDTQVPGFGVRVTENGIATFILRDRYPFAKNAARRELGRVGVMDLADAREKARAWKKLIALNIDPAVEEERQRAAQRQKRANVFESVAEDFIREKLPGERKGKDVEREVRLDLLPAWGKLPIGEITPQHVLTVILAKKNAGRGKGAGARNLLALVKRLFRWAMAQQAYGITASPCAAIQAGMVLGDVSGARDRTLTNDELKAFWQAAKAMSYPFGTVYEMLALTALRLNEVARASWSEFDMREGIWVIPAERMKGKNTGKKQARAHAVPITAEIRELLERLPRFNKGRFLFSTCGGEKPVHVGTKIKESLDSAMTEKLRQMADDNSVELKPFVNHDIRRTVRSHLSRLKVAEEAREAVLAHVRPGIKGTYDHHTYFDEKREALEMWAARLKSIVESA